MLKNSNEFMKNVLTLMSGSAMAQAIPIAVSPILTRIYSPEDFGILALYLGLVSILSILATGRYEYAIVLPKNDKDAFNILILTILIIIVVSSILVLVFYIFNTEITTFLGNPEISQWLYLIPLSVFLTANYQVFNYWNTRKKSYKNIAKSQIVRSSTTVSTNLLMGLGGLLNSGLIMGSVVGQTFSAVVLGKITFNENRYFLKNIKKLKMLVVLKKYKKLPIYNLPNAILDNLKMLGVTIMIGKLFTLSILGQFSLAWKMLQVPMSLIGSSLSQVFYVELAQTNVKSLRKVIRAFLFKTSIVIFPIFVSIYLFSEYIFSFVFGQEWVMAGTIASILSPWMFFNFLTSPLASIFIILNKQEILLVYSIITFCISIGILLIFHNDGVLVVLRNISMSMSILLFFFIGLLFFTIETSLNENLFKRCK